MKLLADVHISPRTVEFLVHLGHDAVRVNDILSPQSTDEAIIAKAAADGRCVLTQDLDFSALIALSGASQPSIISLRLSSSRVEHVNAILERALPGLEQAALDGAIITVEDHRIRQRPLPILG